jgi:oxygen-independent coproporphyrinogen-3 oxidase
MSDTVHNENIAMSSDFAIYIHVPYCLTRCGYCDFNTYRASELTKNLPINSYADLLIAEICLARAHILASYTELSAPKSVFFGGGTPSLLPLTDLERILESLQSNFNICQQNLTKLNSNSQNLTIFNDTSQNLTIINKTSQKLTATEITLEANPDTLTADYIKTLPKLGINRLSIGMQSAVPSVLRTLDRTHTPENVEFAIKEAKNAGLQTSLDLIFGAPNETVNDWKTSLMEAIRLNPDHISCYSLTIEKGTPIYTKVSDGTLQEQSEDEFVQKYLLADNILAECSYENYEISNWATQNHESIHNRIYWQNGSWLGLGAGAHSHFQLNSNDKTGSPQYERHWNLANPLAYKNAVEQGKLPTSDLEVLSHKTHNQESVMLALRTKYGVDAQKYAKLLDGTKIIEFTESGLLTRENECITLTQKGRLLADFVTREILIH